MKLEGSRINTIKKVLKIDEDKELPELGQGDWQEVVELNEKWVLKMIKPHNFAYIGYNGNLESAQRLEEIVKNHTDFLYKFFGNIYPKPRVVLGQSKTKHGQLVNVVYKLQSNLESQKFYDNKRNLPNDWNLAGLLHTQPTLRADFKKLFEGWRQLKESGLSMDLSFRKNSSLIVEPDGTIRLKVYDSIPLYLIDQQKYENSTLPQDLITVDVNKLPVDTKGPKEAEELYKFLEKYFK